ncbi:hypothetical protein EDEG_00687 [Edhazardia aedis USNM 41457]|uniref:Uncharacterized protein n=1 Tax=Edhazardia aedis (strain USNM 41457) TaxID=1003232 RepID=J9DVA5_EDHAE|nr:hypothetical protein EDEG_00687 [Edhazardia aedis USNM 41457]|eukprot:EJW05222.1 hypothetical protein EDEG_00687 [Edhazardia aedis USNM 41457]
MDKYLMETLLIATSEHIKDESLPNNIKLFNGDNIIEHSFYGIPHFFYVLKSSRKEENKKDIEILTFQNDPQKILKTFKNGQNNSGIQKVCFSHDGKLLFCLKNDKLTVYTIDGNILAEIIGYFTCITIFGKYIALYCEDGYITLFETLIPQHSDDILIQSSLTADFSRFFTKILKFHGQAVFISDLFFLAASKNKLSLFIEFKQIMIIEFPENIRQVLADSLLTKIYCLGDNKIYIMNFKNNTKYAHDNEIKCDNILNLGIYSSHNIIKIFLSFSEKTLYIIMDNIILTFDTESDIFKGCNKINKINDAILVLNGMIDRRINFFDFGKIYRSKPN